MHDDSLLVDVDSWFRWAGDFWSARVDRCENRVDADDLVLLSTEDLTEFKQRGCGKVIGSNDSSMDESKLVVHHNIPFRFQLGQKLVQVCFLLKTELAMLYVLLRLSKAGTNSQPTGRRMMMYRPAKTLAMSEAKANTPAKRMSTGVSSL